MPPPNGFETFEIMKSNSELAKTGFVAMTAAYSPDLLKRAKTMGFDHTLEKPFSYDDLLSLLST